MTLPELIGASKGAAPGGTDVLVAVCVPFTQLKTIVSPNGMVSEDGVNENSATAILCLVAKEEEHIKQTKTGRSNNL